MEGRDVVSGRFVTDLLSALERRGLPAERLLGDLPIAARRTDADFQRNIEWSQFVELMRRLERAVDGPAGLESCGEMIGDLEPTRILRGLVGMTASPLFLYRAASLWTLRRLLPGVEMRVTPAEGGCVEIHARLLDGLRTCPPLFHFATGAARALPRILGLPDAVVTAEVDDREAHYSIKLPPSSTVFARARRIVRMLSSAGSVLEFLESQQLELHARHAALQRAHHSLAESEERYRALTDAAADVLCEIDESGHVVYVSASIRELIGFRPEQVIGSHYRLWLPREYHAVADARFAAVASGEPGAEPIRELVTLHAGGSRRIVVEISLRTYRNKRGALRIVTNLRDVTERAVPPRTASAPPPRSRASDPVTALRKAITRLSTRSPAVGTDEGRASSVPVLRHSLEALVAAIESSAADGQAASSRGHGAAHEPGTPGDGLPVENWIEATDRMRRIVEGAMLLARDEGGGDRSLELAKLLEAVSTELSLMVGDRPIELRIDPEGAPAEISCQPEILEGGLVSLLDHALDGIPGAGRIELTVASDGFRGAGAVEFRCVGAREEPPGRTGDPASDAPTDGTTAVPSDLALAIAMDAATAHGGELVLEPGASGGTMTRLRIPQSGGRLDA